MLKAGRVCVKIAGRDSGHVCVVLEEKDGRYLVAGPKVRKRWINPLHLEPLPQEIDIKDEKKAMEELAKIEEELRKAQMDQLKLLAMRAQKRALSR